MTLVYPNRKGDRAKSKSLGRRIVPTRVYMPERVETDATKSRRRMVSKEASNESMSRFAASSENDRGNMNLASENSFDAVHDPVQRCSHPWNQ